MAKVYVVNMLCPDDSDDTTQVVGVCATRERAERRITELEDELKELHDGDDTLELPEYSIEEHDLID
jgi:hypothetical protein